MKFIISIIVALGLLIAGIFAIITCNSGGGGDTSMPVTEAPPIAASAGKSFTPPAMPAGPHDAESIVVSYNLSEVLEMPTTNVWGGQQSRIVRQGDDLYVIYGTDNTLLDGDEAYVLYRYSSARDEWTYFYELHSYESPNLHAAANGKVYATYIHARGLGILEYDPAADTITLQDFGVYWPAQHEKDHWAYMSTGISEGRYIWYLGCGNIDGGHARPGGFAIYKYDTITRTFDTGAQPRYLVDFRHCYNYILDNRDGGITIAGERDIFWEVSEWDMPEGAFGAIFDEINFWTYKDNNLSDIHRVDKASQGKNCPVPNAAINYAGDAYLDLSGYLHILYTLTAAEIGGRTELWHAVYKEGTEIKKERLIEGTYSVRFVEDTAGQLYLVAIPYDSHTIWLFKANAQHELTLTKEILIEGDNSYGLQYAGMAATVPRTGSAPADFVDVLYPNADRTEWIYFRLQLR